MKPIKQIALGVLLTLSIFSAVIYSSCSKNECGAVTCLNKGVCVGGICKCTTGIYGANCELIYSKKYEGIYKGLPPDDASSDTTNTLIFSTTSDTTNYNLMDVLWIDTTGNVVVNLSIELTNNSSAGSNFNVSPVKVDNYTYTGVGSVDGTTASLRLTKTDTLGGSTNLYFNSYIRF